MKITFSVLAGFTGRSVQQTLLNIYNLTPLLKNLTTLCQVRSIRSSYARYALTAGQRSHVPTNYLWSCRLDRLCRKEKSLGANLHFVLTNYWLCSPFPHRIRVSVSSFPPMQTQEVIQDVSVRLQEPKQVPGVPGRQCTYVQ